MNEVKNHSIYQPHLYHKNYTLMNTLNQAFKKRTKKFSSNPVDSVKTDVYREVIRKSQLNEWKNAKDHNMDMADLISMRRAQQKSMQRKKLIELGNPSFREKRETQLKLWRKKGSWQSR